MRGRSMDKEEKIEALRKRITENNEAWIAWSNRAAEACVDELLAGKLFKAAQADFARKIVAQQLHILLISGLLPPN